MIRAAAVVGLLALASPVAAAEAHAGRPVMGTILQVAVEAGDDATAQALAAQALTIAAHWDDVLTTWRAEGELARLNAAAGGGPFAPSADLRAALATMLQMSGTTGGAFNPAVGTTVEMWRGAAAGARPQPAPALAEALRLTAEGALLASGVRLDAGAVGKGIALDAAARALVAGGATAVWLDFGGSSQLAWSGGRRPRAVAVAGVATGVVHGVLEFRDGALATSRASGAGAAQGPIVDPRSGAPVPAPRLATVRCRDATSADVWSTALVVRGREGLAAVRRSGCEALVEDAEGVVTSAEFWGGGR